MPRLTADDVWGFVNLVLAPELDGRVATPEFHRELWGLCCSDFRYVAAAAPRGHAKSTSVSLAFALASSLFRDSPYTIIISDTEEQAAEFLGDIKVALSENENLISLFGVAKIVRDTQTDIIVRMADGHVFRIIAKGSEQKIRGRKWRGMRPKLIIGDDLEGDEQVLNKDRRDKFKRWVQGAVLPALADDGRARFVGTILHMDSFLESRMPNERDPETVRTELCTKNMVPGRLWASARYRAHNQDFSQILWPEKFSVERLRALRQQYIDDGIPEVYSQEYLNYPIDESTSYFKREDFIPMTDDDRLKFKRHYSSADFAITKNERSDFTVIPSVGVDDEGIWYVVDVRRGRWDSLQIIDEMFSVQQRYEPELFGAESGQIEKSLGPFLKDEMLRRNIFINLVTMTPTKDKQARARALQAKMRAGKVRFDTEAEWFPDLMQEMMRFPKDVHDDQVDALAWIGLMLTQMIDAPTPQELADDEYDEEFGDYYEGRSAICGY